MWKDSNRNIVVIFQPNILRIVGFYVRHSASVTLDLYLLLSVFSPAGNTNMLDFTYVMMIWMTLGLAAKTDFRY